MKQIITLFLVLSSFFVNAQKTIITPYFSFQCNCVEVENEYNSKNKSYNYSYQTNNSMSIYMISVKTSTIDQNGYLEAIKNSGTFNYKNTTFKGLKAISADISLNELFSRHVAFFNKNKAFSIIIGSNSKENLNNIFSNFSKTFNFK